MMKSFSFNRKPAILTYLRQLKKSDLNWLLHQSMPVVHIHIAALLCLVLSSVASVWDPLIMRWLIDVVLPKNDVLLLAVAGAMFLSVYAGSPALGLISSQLTFRAMQRM